MPILATHMKPVGAPGTCLAHSISHVDIKAESAQVNLDRFLSNVLHLSVSHLL